MLFFSGKLDSIFKLNVYFLYNYIRRLTTLQNDNKSTFFIYNKRQGGWFFHIYSSIYSTIILPRKLVQHQPKIILQYKEVMCILLHCCPSPPNFVFNQYPLKHYFCSIKVFSVYTINHQSIAFIRLKQKGIRIITKHQGKLVHIQI